jgi:hypothetical protein
MTPTWILMSEVITPLWTSGGFGALDLVGVDWRLDYHVKSSVTGNDNEPVSYLTLRYFFALASWLGCLLE